MDVDKAWVSVCVSQHVYGMPMCKIGGFVCIDSWGMCIQVAFPGARAPPASCRDEDGLSSPGSLTIKGGVFVLHFSTGSYKFSFSEDWGGERLGTGSIVTPRLPAGSWSSWRKKQMASSSPMSSSTS